MPYTVEVPGRGVVEVPDDVPLEEASREIEKAFPPTGEEVASILSSNPDYVPTVEEFKLFKDYSAQKSVDWSEAIAQGIDSILKTAESAAVAGVSGAALNPANYLEGFAQGTQQMVDLVSQSQDPESPLFKFKNYITGDGSIESQRQQFIEARKQAKEADQYARGEKTFLPKELVNPEYVQGVAMVADPSLFFPGLGQVLGAEKVAAKAVGKAVQATGKAVQAVSRPVQRAAAAVGEKLTEAVGTSPEAMRGALATSGVLAATGAGPAVGLVGAIPVVAGAATDIGTALEAAGGQLYRAPTRIGALESIGKIPEANLRQRVIGTIGRYGGDAALNAALVGTTGSLEGAAIGGVLGYLSGGEEGAAAGIGSGAASGALGSLGARGVQTLTGQQARAARKGDFDRYVAAQDEKTAGLLLDLEARHGLDVASSFMDATGVVRGVLGDVGVNLLSSEDFRKKFGVGSRGVQVVEAETPAVYINADIYGKGKGDNPLYTLGHEMFHAFESSQQLADRASEVKDALVGSYVTKDGVVTKVTNGLFDDAEVDRRFNEYRDKLTPERAASLAEYDTTEKRGRFIASEIAGEYMGALLAGQKPDSMLRGFGGSTRSLLDSVLIKNADSALNRIAQKIEQTFGTKPVDSVLFPEIKKASPQLNAMLRDLVRARGKLDERILAGDNDVTRAVRPGDMGNPISAKIAEDFGLAETENGVTRWLSDEVINLRNNRDNTAIQDILLTRPGARLIDGAIYGRLSPEQLSAIEQSQQVSSRAKDKIRAVAAAIENGNSIFIDYNAATRRVLNKLTGKYRSVYSSGIRLSQREVLPYAFYFSQADNPVIKAIDITKMRRVLEKMTASDGTVSGQWQNIDGFMSDFARYLTNLDSGMREPSAKLFGEEKAKILANVFNEQEKGGRKFIRDFRLDRMGSVDPRNFRAKVSEEAIQFSKLRWMPDETVGDTRVINSEEGYRIVAKDKYRLYGPDGKLIGIYDKQQQAERKADATQTRLQPEIDQLQRPARNEVRQTAEAGGRNRIERGTQGSQEGGEVNQPVRQAGDVGRFMPDQQGFYSKLEEVATNKLPKSATPQQILATVDPAKGSGVKAEELKWTGFAQAVERIAKENGGKVPKEKLMEHLQNERRVRFEEVTRETKPSDVIDETQYSKYQLPGGQTYREIVLTSDTAAPYTSSHFKDIPNYVAHMRVNERAGPDGKPGLFIEEIQSDRHQQAREKGYKTDFSEIQKQISELQDRHDKAYQEWKPKLDAAEKAKNDLLDLQTEILTPYYKEVGAKNFSELLILSSKSPEAKSLRENRISLARNNPAYKELEAKRDALIKEADKYSKPMMELSDKIRSLESQIKESVPDAPFRKDWSLQMFKRGLRDAVASGKEWIGWTTGETQAERYDLSQQVDYIDYRRVGPDKYDVGVVGKNGSDLFSEEGINQSRISDVLGKEIADKMAKGEGQSGGGRMTLRGLDLKVGGEGMKGFYDKILPAEVQKYVKQWGGEVKKSEITTPETAGQNARLQHELYDPQGNLFDAYETLQDAQNAARDAGPGYFVKSPERSIGTTIWRVDITPQMRESVQKTGQPRFMPSDADYLAAVKAGDTAQAQRMVDEAAKAAGYTVGPVYHGTPNSDFTVFDPKKIGSKTVLPLGAPKGFYFAKDQSISKKYGDKSIRAFLKGPFLLENDKIVVAESSDQIKSADPITRDNSGNVIPLSQRFQQSSADIRYMPDYSGEHSAPRRDSGAPMDNLKGVYPDDIYGPNAARYYGHEAGSQNDKAAVRILQATKGKPDAPVKVFRAIPKQIQSDQINPGDWITTIKSYAVQHGESALGGDYKILEKTVSAGDLYTDGNSIFEFGYDPRYMPQPDPSVPGAYSVTGGFRILPGKTKGRLRVYGPAGSLIGIAGSLDEAQRMIRRKTKTN